MDELTKEVVHNIVYVCTKPNTTAPKLAQLTCRMFELDFTSTVVDFSAALNILDLLYLTKIFKNLELVVSTETGLFTYTPKAPGTPKTLQKLNFFGCVSFSIYLYV